MIKAFKEMIDSGLTGWELHLAGGSTQGAIHQEYLQTVKDESEGYPIIIQADIKFSDLVKIYGESSIYWHASGFGEDELREPVKFEHFGITTVEAMASGCVPVVIAKGGQKEMVKHGENGFLWGNLSQLKEYTLTLIQDPLLQRRLSQSAQMDCQHFDKSNFMTILRKQLVDINVLK